jgi:hypothetical protein
MEIKKPSLEEVNSVDLSPIFSLFKFFPEVKNGDVNYLDRPAGTEHYKLLGWLSKQINNSIISEIGTGDGMGLLALSLNESNKIISYDIQDYNLKHLVPENGTRVICEKNFNYYEDIIKSSIIFYDANHNGNDEYNFFLELKKLNWKGILIYDDIYLNDEMKSFWAKIDIQKEDWTDIGHLSCGTGAIFFN